MVGSASLFRAVRVDESERPIKFAIVGDPSKSFSEEGLILLDLEAKVLAAYNINENNLILSRGLFENEKKAAQYLGKACSRIYKFFRENDYSLQEISIGAIKYYAATNSMSLQEIKKYTNGRGLRSITAKELSQYIGFPLELAEYRIETLKLRDPDFHVNLRKKFGTKELSYDVAESSQEDDVLN